MKPQKPKQNLDIDNFEYLPGTKKETKNTEKIEGLEELKDYMEFVLNTATNNTKIIKELMESEYIKESLMEEEDFSELANKKNLLTIDDIVNFVNKRQKILHQSSSNKLPNTTTNNTNNNPTTLSIMDQKNDFSNEL